jgi:hypothetical protein
VTMSGVLGLITGCSVDTVTSQGLQAMGMSQGTANLVDAGISIGGSLATGWATAAARGTAATSSGISDAALAKGNKFFNDFGKGVNQQTQQLGRFTKFSVDVTGKNPNSFTRWVKFVNENGKTVRLYHDTFITKTMKFINRGIKVPGPTRHVW